jgi:hypothetical protein
MDDATKRLMMLGISMAADSGEAVDAVRRAGQNESNAQSVLPTDGLDPEVAEKIGIKVLDAADSLFTNVEMPEGWTKRAESDLWSSLLDDKGRRRAGIFHDAGYDRRAHMSWSRRFGTHEQHYEDEQVRTATIVVEDRAVLNEDGEGKVVIAIGSTSCPPDRKPKEEFLRFYDEKKDLDKQAEAWLDEHKPGWRDPENHWD